MARTSRSDFRVELVEWQALQTGSLPFHCSHGCNIGVVPLDDDELLCACYHRAAIVAGMDRKAWRRCLVSFYDTHAPIVVGAIGQRGATRPDPAHSVIDPARCVTRAMRLFDLIPAGKDRLQYAPQT
jgi:hypothetical protein